MHKSDYNYFYGCFINNFYKSNLRILMKISRYKTALRSLNCSVTKLETHSQGGL